MYHNDKSLLQRRRFTGVIIDLIKQETMYTWRTNVYNKTFACNKVKIPAKDTRREIQFLPAQRKAFHDLLKRI